MHPKPLCNRWSTTGLAGANDDVNINLIFSIAPHRTHRCKIPQISRYSRLGTLIEIGIGYCILSNTLVITVGIQNIRC